MFNEWSRRRFLYWIKHTMILHPGFLWMPQLSYNFNMFHYSCANTGKENGGSFSWKILVQAQSRDCKDPAWGWTRVGQSGRHIHGQGRRSRWAHLRNGHSFLQVDSGRKRSYLESVKHQLLGGGQQDTWIWRSSPEYEIPQRYGKFLLVLATWTLFFSKTPHLPTFLHQSLGQLQQLLNKCYHQSIPLSIPNPCPSIHPPKWTLSCITLPRR